MEAKAGRVAERREGALEGAPGSERPSIPLNDLKMIFEKGEAADQVSRRHEDWERAPTESLDVWLHPAALISKQVETFAFASLGCEKSLLMAGALSQSLCLLSKSLGGVTLLVTWCAQLWLAFPQLTGCSFMLQNGGG